MPPESENEAIILVSNKRIVLFGLVLDPNNWFMSAAIDFINLNYPSGPDDVQSDHIVGEE